jgi:PAS domain S-box-containing protein
MANTPHPPQPPPAPLPRYARETLAWLPIPILVALVVILRSQGSLGTSLWPRFAQAQDILAPALAAILVLRAGQNFLARGEAGFLAIGLGTLCWGTIRLLTANLKIQAPEMDGAWLAASAHMAASILLLGARPSPQGPRARSALGLTLTVGIVAFLSLAVLGAAKVLADPPAGGTEWARILIRSSALCLFLAAALLIGWRRASYQSAFHAWYARALMLFATAMLGSMLRGSRVDLVGCAARLSQELGSVYLLVALGFALRENLDWETDLGEALRASQDQYRALFTAMIDGFGLHEILLDPSGRPVDWRFLDVNPAFEQLTGLKREEVVGRTHNEVLPGDDSKWLQKYGEVALTGEPARFEQYSPALKRHYEVFAYRPAPLQFAVIFRDITERRRMEESLRQSEATLRAVLDASRDAIWLFGPDGTVLLGNEAAWGRFPVRREDVLGRPFMAFVPQDLADSRFRLLRQAFATADSVEFEDERAGRILHNSYHPVLDHEGKPFMVASFSQDITERRRTEEALAKAFAEAEQGRLMLAAIMEHVPEGITVADASGFEIRMVSRHGLRLMGPHEGERIEDVTRRATVFQPDGVTPMANEDLPLVRAIQRGEIIQNFEIVQRDPAGRLLPLLCNAAPLRDAKGTIVGGIIAWRDISEMKRAEAALKRTVADLERSNRELSQFAYISSHDLQEPLRQILVYADLFQSGHAGPLAGRQLEYFGMIQEGAQRMTALIQGLLAYSRVGSPHPAAHPLPFQEALDAALANLRSRIEATGARITQDPLPTLGAEPTQIIQLFQNLMSNALKFHRDGVPPRIHVGCAREEGRHHFTIEDNGIGIDPRYHERIFQIFQRLHNREKYPGTGIGLAICRKIVEQHGGRLWLDSSPGGGATFHFTLGE